MEKNKKCVAYLRVSSKEQAQHQNRQYGKDEDKTIEAQRRTLDIFLKNHKDFELVLKEPFEDVQSGTSLKKRNGLRDCISYLTSHSKEVDTLLVCFFDRLGRNFEDLFQMIQTFNNNRITVYEIGDPKGSPSKLTWFDEQSSDESQRVMINTINLAVKAYASQSYVERLSTRARTKNEEKVATGNAYFGGYAKYGYMYIPSMGKSKETNYQKKVEIYRNCSNFKYDEYFVLEDEAAIIREIYDLYVNGKHGAPYIANLLNSRGLRHRTKFLLKQPIEGKLYEETKFTSSFIRDILTSKSYGDGSYPFRQQSNIFQRKNVSNEIYKAELRYNQGTSLEYKELPIEEKKAIAKELTENDPYVQIDIPNVYPVILDRNIFEKAQSMIREKSKTFTRYPKLNVHDALLSGLLYCGSCGSKMYSNGRRSGEGRKSRFVPGYNCNGHREKGQTICTGNRFISANKIETVVWTALKEELQTGKLKKAYKIMWDKYIESLTNMPVEERNRRKRELEKRKKNLINDVEANMRMISFLEQNDPENTKEIEKREKANKEISAQLRKISAEIKELNESVNDRIAKKELLLENFEYTDSLEQNKRETILRHISKVVFFSSGENGAHIEIYFDMGIGEIKKDYKI